MKFESGLYGGQRSNWLEISFFFIIPGEEKICETTNQFGLALGQHLGKHLGMMSHIAQQQPRARRPFLVHKMADISVTPIHENSQGGQGP